MLSFLFLAYAATHLGLWLWGWKRWAETGRPVALFVVLFGSTLLFYDNFRIGIGRFIGAGDTLYALSVPAFAWHWSMLPLLVIAAGSVARLASLQWAGNRRVMGAFCAVAVALMVLDVPKIFDMDLRVACLADTVRYTTNVAPDQVCPGGQPFKGSGAAMVAILTNVVVLGVGIALWVQRRWPWLAIGSAAMFVAAGAFARSRWSLPIANFGEICITLGFIVTCAHFAAIRTDQDTARIAPDARAHAGP